MRRSCARPLFSVSSPPPSPRWHFVPSNGGGQRWLDMDKGGGRELPSCLRRHGQWGFDGANEEEERKGCPRWCHAVTPAQRIASRGLHARRRPSSVLGVGDMRYWPRACFVSSTAYEDVAAVLVHVPDTSRLEDQARYLNTEYHLEERSLGAYPVIKERSHSVLLSYPTPWNRSWMAARDAGDSALARRTYMLTYGVQGSSHGLWAWT
ncbi:hypothetical protein J3F83DRAFT_613420 [Trichoderma novae-zelandiae]